MPSSGARYACSARRQHKQRGIIIDLQISTYVEPRWGARATGTATIRKDSQARYYVDDVSVAEMRNVGLFTVVTCVNSATYNVLTAFLQLVDRKGNAEASA